MAKIYLHEEAAAVPCNGNYLSNLLRIHPQWFFTQDMFLSLKKQFAERDMFKVVCPDVDNICRERERERKKD